MKGFVPTPDKIVDLMVFSLFHGLAPRPDSTILDPGCGTGVFIEGIIRWCRAHRKPIPRILGVELDHRHVPTAEAKFLAFPTVKIEKRDFLEPPKSQFDFIIGNPPYVPITELSEDEKARYRSLFSTATGRFDLYLLFFEQALRSLKPGGRLVFITPEKFLYVETAAPLRKLLASKKVEEVRLMAEDVFGDLVTYPTITTLINEAGPSETKVLLRDGRSVRVTFPADGSSWLPKVNGRDSREASHNLMEASIRVSCGVATGADSVFIRRTEDLDSVLRPFAYPTIAGRELTRETRELKTVRSLLVPYDEDGRLLPGDRLGALGKYLARPENRARLEKRTCVARKPWYAFHETPPLRDLLRPKILCKDITVQPRFWVDHEGSIVPRHSVYYVVPRDPSRIDELAAYLNSDEATEWLRANCQRAANGFLRLQSRVLKRLPIPENFLPAKKPRGRERQKVATNRAKPVEAFG